MEIINSEWMSFHAAQEEERQPTTAHEAKEEKQATNKIAEQLPPHFVTHMLTVLATLPSEEPNKLFFMDALQAKDGDENPLLFKDAKEKLKPHNWIGKAFHLSIDYSTFLHNPAVDLFLDKIDHDELLGHNEPFDTMAFAIRAKATIPKVEALQPYLAWQPLEVVCRTWKIPHNWHACNCNHPYMTIQNLGSCGKSPKTAQNYSNQYNVLKCQGNQRAQLCTGLLGFHISLYQCIWDADQE